MSTKVVVQKKYNVWHYWQADVNKVGSLSILLWALLGFGAEYPGKKAEGMSAWHSLAT